MSERMQTFTPNADATDDLRSAFGRFGTGVTIVTVHTPDGPLGMTANSFSSVSLDPALVLWSPARHSKRHDAFVAAPRFSIHILGADQYALALRFAAKGDDFSGLDWSDGTRGSPTFAGCLATFECDTYAVHPAGDHSIILGQIRHAAVQKSDAPGLMFDRGRFGRFEPKA